MSSTSTRDVGSMPCARMSWVYEVSWRDCATLGLATNVPRPCWRSSRPSTTSSCRAWRTVVLEVPNSTARVRSGGTGLPGGSVLVSSVRWRLSR